MQLLNNTQSAVDLNSLKNNNNDDNKNNKTPKGHYKLSVNFKIDCLHTMSER